MLDAAYAAHPERFVRRPPRPGALPSAVWINPPRATPPVPEVPPVVNVGADTPRMPAGVR